MRAVLPQERDVVVEYFDDDAHATRTVAMERIVHADPALTAGQLQRVSQTQDQLVGIVRERIGSEDTDDPRAPAIVGAALSCLIAKIARCAAGRRTTEHHEIVDPACMPFDDRSASPGGWPWCGVSVAERRRSARRSFNPRDGPASSR
jgi:hypothetical protein